MADDPSIWPKGKHSGIYYEYTIAQLTDILQKRGSKIGQESSEDFTLSSSSSSIPQINEKIVEDAKEHHDYILGASNELLGERYLDIDQTNYPYGILLMAAQNNVACFIKDDTSSGYKPTLRFFEKALQLNETFNGSEHEFNHILLHNKGNDFYKNKNYKSAEECYQKALSIKSKIFDKNDIQIIDTKSSLAMCLYHENKFPEAEIYFTEILLAHQINHGINSEIFINCQKKLINTLLHQKKYVEVEVIWRNMLENICKVMETSRGRGNKEKKIDIVHQIADVLYKQKKYVEAKDTYESIPYSMGGRVFFYKYCQVLSQLGEYQSVLDLCGDIVKCRLSQYGSSDPVLLHGYSILGDNHIKMKKYKDGLEYYQKILSVYEVELGDENYLTLTIIDTIGKIYEKMNNFTESENYFLRAINGFENSIGEQK